MEEARADAAGNRLRYPNPWPGNQRPNAPFEVGRSTCRWLEEPEATIGRCEGFADEIARRMRYRWARAIDHTGWYLRDDGDSSELARGVVFRLPHGRGFMVGVADPYNKGPVALSTDIEPGDAADDEAALMDAARSADHLAEVYAEIERDYARASDARIRYEDLGDTIKTIRKATLALLAEIKAIRKSLCGSPEIIATLRGKIADAVEEIAKSRRKRARLAGDFARCDGWSDY